MKTFKGQLEGFPEEIVEKMLENQVLQGCPRDITIFEKNRCTSYACKGFDWNQSKEGKDFWTNVLVNKNFDAFFKKYPKKAPYPKVMWVDNDSLFLNPIKRVVVMEKNGKYLAWSYASTIIDAENQVSILPWSYAKDIEPEPIEKIVELTIEDISNGKGVGVKSHLIRIKK